MPRSGRGVRTATERAARPSGKGLAEPPVLPGAAGTDTQDVDRCARLLTGQLRDLAWAALAERGMVVRRLRWMGRHTNHLFRCDTAAGERMGVRVCLPGGRSDAELDAELTWLPAIPA